MNLVAGDYLIVSGSRPTNFSIYINNSRTWITQATLINGVLQGVEDNKAFSKKDAKAIRKAIVDHIMTL